MGVWFCAWWRRATVASGSGARDLRVAQGARWPLEAALLPDKGYGSLMHRRRVLSATKAPGGDAQTSAAMGDGHRQRWCRAGAAVAVGGDARSSARRRRRRRHLWQCADLDGQGRRTGAMGSSSGRREKEEREKGD